MNWLTSFTTIFALSCLSLNAANAQTPAESNNLAQNSTVTSSDVSNKSLGKQVKREKSSTPLRAQLQARAHTSPVWVDSTWLEYVTDLDGDGFFHHFRFGFDADTDFTDQLIYAELYLVDGDREILLFESSDFWLTGRSGEDTYEVTTSLDTGYAPQTYDLVLRLYNANNHAPFTELTYLDDPTLANLFLEDATNDTDFYSAPYIYQFTTELSDDHDGDGFYTNLTMTVDIDAPFETTAVQMGVEIYDPLDGWVLVLLTDDWYIEGTLETDAQTIEIALENGFPEADYEVRLTVYEPLSRAIVATETIRQRLALESEDYDHRQSFYFETTTSTSTPVGVSASGGALGFLALPLLIVLGLRRRP
jgi:hypothetical protein